MPLDLSAPEDDGPETAAAELPPEVLERIEAIETKAAAVADVAARLDKIETRLARPSARVEVREDQAQLEQKAFPPAAARASTAWQIWRRRS